MLKMESLRNRTSNHLTIYRYSPILICWSVRFIVGVFLSIMGDWCVSDYLIVKGFSFEIRFEKEITNKSLTKGWLINPIGFWATIGDILATYPM